MDGRCWLCGWSGAAAGAHGSAVVAPPVVVPSAPTRELRPFQFSISGLLVATTVVAVCLGALLAAPGLGMLLIVALVFAVIPALIRTSLMGARRQKAGGLGTTHQRKMDLMESLGLAIAASTLGFMAFGVVCFVGLFAVCAAAPSANETALMPLITVVSAVAGLSAAGLLFWVTWPKWPAT